MRFTHEQRYDAEPGAVHAMLTDRAFRERVCRAQRATAATVSIEPGASGAQVLVDQTRPSDGIPAFARKIVGAQIRILQREHWAGPDARLEVLVPGKPARLEGTINVRAAGAGTVQTIDAELTVAVPVVGARLEKLVAEVLGVALEAEQRVGLSWLAGTR